MPLPSGEELTCSPDVWYEDGSIILRAKNIMFRVYKGILAAQSPVFKDMFAVPQPADAPSYDGCPVVVVHDSPEDMKVFLKALHQWDFTEQPPEFRTTFRLLALSSKYCVDRLLAWAVRPVVHRFASTTLEQHIAAIDKSPPLDGSDLITAINIGRRCDIPEILPVAFFEAAFRLEMDQIFWGVERPGSSGSMIAFDHQTDIKACADGRVRLASAFSVQMIFPPTSCASCRDPAMCNRVLRHSAESMSAMVADPQESSGCLILPLRRIKTLVADLNLQLCGPCNLEVMRRGQEGMNNLWNSLPQLFGLKPRAPPKLGVPRSP